MDESVINNNEDLMMYVNVSDVVVEPVVLSQQIEEENDLGPEYL